MKESNNLSNIEKISKLGWWMVHTTVLPLCAMRRMARIITLADLESRPLVGSSRKMTLGFETISTPIVTRFLCSTLRPVPAFSDPGDCPMTWRENITML